MKKFLVLILVLTAGIAFYSCSNEGNTGVSDSANRSTLSEQPAKQSASPSNSESGEISPLDISFFESVDLSQSDSFSYPLSNLSDGKAKYFLYDGQDGEARFFLLKSSDGVARAAFDACDVCFKAKLGYAQSGDLMVCRKCGQTFPSVKINEIKGGCNPAPLNRTNSDGNIIISKKDIEEGAFYFR